MPVNPKTVLPYRWFFVGGGLWNDSVVTDIQDLITTAAQHGLNGMVLSGGLDTMDLNGPAYAVRLAKVKAACVAAGIELIPMAFSVGYGASVFAHDKNLAEGFPVTVTSVVKNGKTAIPMGMQNILRRPGCPLVVKNDANGLLYIEGIDFLTVVDPLLDYRTDHLGPDLVVRTVSKIKEGDTLRISYYRGQQLNVGSPQTCVCMSEPAVYDIWSKQVAAVHDVLAPRTWFLSMDEIRQCGSCDACKRRKMNPAQIIGDCITKQFAMIRAVNPSADVCVWADMLDPHVNAHASYYNAVGTVFESWKYVPKGIIPVCWNYDTQVASLEFFSAFGFHPMAGVYYDSVDLVSTRVWLESLSATNGTKGVMYTTWKKQYGLLGAFGDLVTGNATRE